MDYYSFNRPLRDGWLSLPCWLTDSGCFTHKVVTRPAISLAQDRESSPARTSGLCYATLAVFNGPTSKGKEGRAGERGWGSDLAHSKDFGVVPLWLQLLLLLLLLQLYYRQSETLVSLLDNNVRTRH